MKHPHRIQPSSPLQRVLAVGWLLMLVLSVLWLALSFARGYRFDTSILALLPTSSQSQVIAAADEQLAGLAAQRMLFLVSHNDPEQSLAAAETFSRIIGTSDLFSEVEGRIDEARSREWLALFHAHRYRLMTDEDRQLLISQSPDTDHPLLQQALARLYSPLAASVAPQLLDDPLQLFFDWQLAALPRGGFIPENGWLSRVYDGRSYRMVAATLAGDPYELEFQQAVLALLDEAKSALEEGAELLSSGLLIHAAHGAAQARQEISTIGLGSILGITLMMLYCFRRGGDLLLVFIPILAGCLLALAASILVFERLHMVTIAFGASLIGVATDYSLHYLCAVHEVYPARQQSVLRRIFPAISLGLASSALAYAAQGMAPFPGLQQMAFFSVVGLLGAWLTVVLCFPLLIADSRQPKGALHPLAEALGRRLERWPHAGKKYFYIVLAVLLLAALLQVLRIDFDDGVARLQTSPPELIGVDQQVQALTQSVNPSQYLLISAADAESLLRREEALRPALAALLDDKLIHDYHAISRWLPSSARQQQHLELYEERVFADGGLAERLARSIGSESLLDDMLQRFEQDRSRALSPAEWLESPVGKAQSHLWLGEHSGQVHSLILLAGAGAELRSALIELAAQHDGVEFVDRVQSISEILQDNRQQLQLWVALAYGLVFLLLSRRYGLQAWRILAAPAIASLFTLAILSAAGAALNIFNLLALLLVLGIGLDAGIFLWESGRNAYSWAAITLANATTLLAFGLLSLSDTPVLHQFGITVLLGVSGAWLLAPSFVKTELIKNHKNLLEPEKTVIQ